MAEDPKPAPKPEQGDVTIQPAVSTEEAAQTDVVLSPVGDDKTTVVPVDDNDVTIRSVSKREIEVRLLPWNTVIDTNQGPEAFARGATEGTPQDGVLLMGMEHEAQMGLGQDGRPVMTRRAIGRSNAVWEVDDGPHVVFRVARTQSGDELLALAEDRIVRGVSLEFSEVPGGTSVVKQGGRRVRVHNRVALKGASMTYRPAYGGQATVLAVRSEGDTVSEDVQEVAAPAIDITPLTDAMTKMAGGFEAMSERLEKIEARSRADFTIPGKDGQDDPRAQRGEWTQVVLRMLSGERVNDVQFRALDDLITTDNLGVVPDAFLSELIGVIDPERPFLNSTRKLDLPAAGMSLIVPKIITRPTTAIQAAEKDDVDSTATSITTATFDSMTIAGGGDISLQLLKRSSPSFLSLYLELLAEAYAQNAEKEAIKALLAASPSSGGALDPSDLEVGAAWVNATAVKKRPNTIWLSSEGVAAFIDAKATGTNAPLYSNIQAGFTAGSGPAGTISGLRPVYLPQLDAASATIDVIVGPSSGFGWTEDGTYTLQVDVPAKAGRDVAIVGMLWFAPLYPTAFTTYTIAS